MLNSREKGVPTSACRCSRPVALSRSDRTAEAQGNGCHRLRASQRARHTAKLTDLNLVSLSVTGSRMRVVIVVFAAPQPRPECHGVNSLELHWGRSWSTTAADAETILSKEPKPRIQHSSAHVALTEKQRSTKALHIPQYRKGMNIRISRTTWKFSAGGGNCLQRMHEAQAFLTGHVRCEGRVFILPH